MSHIEKAVRCVAEAHGTDGLFELWRPQVDQRHFVVRDPEALVRAAHALVDADWYLVAAFAAAETGLEDPSPKVFHIFAPVAPASGDTGFVVLELPLVDPQAYATAWTDPPPAAPPGPSGAHPFRQALRAYRDELERVIAPASRAWQEPPASDPPLSALESDAEHGIRAGARIVVGPVHAGVIEPGRFVFDLVGERIRQVQIDLGYVRRGVEGLFERLDLSSAVDLGRGLALAGAVSGDSAVAHQWAFCSALEAMAQIDVPPRDQYLRGILLELERLIAHVNDVGALARDVAFERLATEFWLMRDELRSAFRDWTGHRFLKEALCVGGVGEPTKGRWEQAWAPGVPARLTGIVTRFRKHAEELWREPRARDRMAGVALVTAADVRHFAAAGPVARSAAPAQRPAPGQASARELDAATAREAAAAVSPPAGFEAVEGLVRPDFRLDHPWGPYRSADCRAILGADRKYLGAPYEGDVLARLTVRIDEADAAYRFIEHFAAKRDAEALRAGPSGADVTKALAAAAPYAYALGWAEGFRGDVLYWLAKGADQRIFRLKIRDPSRPNWRVMEHALCKGETQLADFPLVNKSFNLSYAGNDL